MSRFSGRRRLRKIGPYSISLIVHASAVVELGISSWIVGLFITKITFMLALEKESYSYLRFS